MSLLADNNNSDASSALKLGTDDLHRQVEASIDWKANLEGLGSYRQFLGKVNYFLAPTDRIIENHFGESADWFKTRRTSAWAKSDLDDLAAAHTGMEPFRHPDPQTADQLYLWVKKPADAAGILYVLEGSTMGSQFLCKLASANFDSTVDAPVKFLNAYGKDTARRWQVTKHWLDGFLRSEDEIATAVHAARRMFQIYGDQLSCRK
ncbi:biliverdin-producing heme oxygenase [Bremerella sp. JC770]|uniref:biliverdin-producing heme oxygenase n=1 Tax=Bremerella sp. JC770 TaxID=3232137 RepID=UPI00345A14C9